jgi:hypothetical protein
MSYPTFLSPVERQVRDEREQQDAKWGEQNHPDGTGLVDDTRIADSAKATCQYAASRSVVTWRDILWEEVAEAFAETDVEALRTELIQVATVALNWVEAIDRRDVARRRVPGVAE